MSSLASGIRFSSTFFLLSEWLSDFVKGGIIAEAKAIDVIVRVERSEVSALYVYNFFLCVAESRSNNSRELKAHCKNVCTIVSM